MEKGHGRKLPAIVAVVILFSAVSATQAFGWGSAVHAYIDDHLGRRGPVRNLNEIYGAMVPDVFNFLFSDMDMMKYLYTVTHYQGVGYPDDYINVWEKSHCIFSKAVAFGFVSHNGNFGADLTAHHFSLALPEGNNGYVIQKAASLRKNILPLMLNNGIILPDPVIDELCHDLVEFALDVMITQQNRGLAAKISTAAMLRTPEFPLILVKSYAKGLVQQQFPEADNYPAAVKLILKAENEFRKSMIAYGQALMQDEETAIDLIAQQLVDLAKAFLGGLPPNVDEKVFLGLAKYGLVTSMEICSEDFNRELQATIDYVADKLAGNGISY